MSNNGAVARNQVMDLSQIIQKRRMVRNYRSDPVPAAVVEKILDNARRAPSAGFTQGQSFVVITDPVTRRAIADLAHEDEYVAEGFDPWISSAPVLVVVCTSEAAYRARYAEPDKAGSSKAEQWPVPYWHVDAGAVLMLLLLAVVDQGLAAGFAGSHNLGAIGELLGIPQDVTPIGLVTIGWGAPDRHSGSLKRGRIPLEDVIHWERW